MKRVAFIIPKYKNVWEPLGVASIASFCHTNYRGVLHTDVFNLNFQGDVDRLDFKDLALYDIIAFSCTTPTYPECEKMAKLLKLHRDVHIVIGGWHPTSTPQTIHSAFDQVVIGEGELPFLQILGGNKNRFITGGRLPFKDLEWPDRDLIDQSRMLDLCEGLCGERIVSLQSRRGCSHSCTMCSEKLMSGNNVRVRDPDDVLDELEYIDKTFKITKFKFLDPTWAHPKSAVIDFCNAKIQRRNEVPFEGMAHIAYMDQHLLQLIKLAGCDQLNFGVESGSQVLLNSMKKGVTIQKIKDVFKWAKLEGISRRAFFILGMPDETYDTVQETRELIHSISPDVVGFSMLCPYPSTPYWKSEFNGTNLSKMDEYSNDLISSKYLSNSQLKDIQEGLNKEFYDILVAHKK